MGLWITRQLAVSYCGEGARGDRWEVDGGELESINEGQRPYLNQEKTNNDEVLVMFERVQRGIGVVKDVGTNLRTSLRNLRDSLTTLINLLTCVLLIPSSLDSLEGSIPPSVTSV